MFERDQTFTPGSVRHRGGILTCFSCIQTEAGEIGVMLK